MIEKYRVLLAVSMITIAVFATTPRAAAAERAESKTLLWAANAVQWDSVWGSGVTCSDHGPTLFQQLFSSKDHNFSADFAQYSDGMEVSIPELHRIVSIGLTSDGEFASVRIETNCDTDLASRDTKLKSLDKGPPVQDARLKQHLNTLRKAAPSTKSQQRSTAKSILRIKPPAATSSVIKQQWPRAKSDALLSVANAARDSFGQACEPGWSGVVLIPDFHLYDPSVLTVIKSKQLNCVLPIGFKRRQSSADPYVAYAMHNCVEDPAWVEKVQRLIALHAPKTKELSCHKRSSK